MCWECWPRQQLKPAAGLGFEMQIDGQLRHHHDAVNDALTSRAGWDRDDPAADNNDPDNDDPCQSLHQQLIIPALKKIQNCKLFFASDTINTLRSELQFVVDIVHLSRDHGVIINWLLETTADNPEPGQGHSHSG